VSPLAEPAAALRGVTFTYRGAATPALRDVSLRIGRGEVVLLMGASGAGKSTLARCLNRTIPQFLPGILTGSVVVAGSDVGGATVADLAGVVGLVSQDFEAQLFSTSVRHEVAFGMEQLGVPRPEMARRLAAALAVVGLAGFDRRDPVTLSGGEKQRLAIAALLAQEPALLVLDEPTTDLDPAGKSEIFAVLATLRRRGASVLLIEHETGAAEFADRLVLMQEGRVVADGAPAALLPDVVRLEALGVRPLDGDRLGAALGWRTRAASVEDAAARLRPLMRPRALADAAPAAPAPLPLCGAAPRVPIGTARRDVVQAGQGGWRPPDGAEVLVRVAGLRHAYAPDRAALDGVSLEIRRGDFVALIGRNGSGKTTLAKCLNGLLVPQRGRVDVRGRALRDLTLAEVAADVGYVFQNPDQQIFAASAYDEVAFAPRNAGLAEDEVARRVQRVLAAVGLDDCGPGDPFLLGKGERQRLAVASLLALEPALLILDEPTTGLDYAEQRRMMHRLAALHAGGLTLVIITHTPWVVAEYAQRGVVLSEGRVVFDGPLRALLAEEALLASARFRLPDCTRIGRALGLTPLSVDELLVAVSPGGAA